MIDNIMIDGNLVLVQRKFTLWSWFYKAASVLIAKSYFRDLWEKQLIEGFIGKGEEEVLLRNNGTGMKVGDFLVRFSHSCERDLCVTFVVNNRKS